MPAKDLRKMALASRDIAHKALRKARKERDDAVSVLDGDDKRFARDLSSRVINELHRAYNTAQDSVFSAFMNETLFELKCGRRKRLVRIVRFSNIINYPMCISSFNCTKSRFDSGKRPSPDHTRIDHGSMMKMSFVVSEFGEVTFSLPALEDGTPDIYGEVSAKVVPVEK